MTDLPSYPGTPLWAKVFGIITIVVILLFIIVMFTRGPGGRHGPRRHAPTGDAVGQPPPSSITEVHTLPEVER